MPELRQLRAFVAVAERRSFTRAAEDLHLQQQTVSKTVRALEAELGTELLQRTTREVRLTAAGAALLESGRLVLRDADAAFAQARSVGSGELGTIRVGVTPAIGPTDREDCFDALDSLGDASISVHELRPGELLARMEARELDLALVRSAFNDPHLHGARLRPTPAVVCVASDHPLTAYETLEPEQLDGLELLVPSRAGTPYTDALVALLADVGAAVIPLEARMTGGPSRLTELRGSAAFTLTPEGTPPPREIAAIPVHGIALPLYLVWPAGLPSAAVGRVRERMSPAG